MCQSTINQHQLLFLLLNAVQAVIILEVQYFSPDGKVGFWKRDDFAYPLVDYDNTDGDETRSTSSFHTSSALAETAFLRSLGLSEEGGSLLDEVLDEDAVPDEEYSMASETLARLKKYDKQLCC